MFASSLRNTLALGAIFLSPLICVPLIGDSIREPKLYFIWGSGFLAIIFAFLQHRNPWKEISLLPKSLLLFAAYIAIQSFLTRSPLEAAKNSFMVICFIFIALEIAKQVEHPYLGKLLYILTCINLLYSLLQILQLDPIFEHQANAQTITGFLGHPTIYGSFMAMLVGYHLPQGNKALAALCFLSAIATGSLFAIFAAVVAALCFFLITKNKYMSSLLIAFVILLTFSAALYFAKDHFNYYPEIPIFHSLVLKIKNLDFYSDSGRFAIWQQTMLGIREKIFFGHGFNSFYDLFPKNFQIVVNGMAWRQAHNELLQAFFELGLVGLFFIAWMLTDFLLSLPSLLKNSKTFSWFLVVIALLANAMGNFPLHIAPLALYALVGWIVVAAKKTGPL